MIDLTARSFTAIAAVGAIGDDNRQWIEVMPTADKARNGRWYFTITRDDLDTYAAYIRDNADRIMVDRDHEGATENGSTKAAGWFTGQTEIVDDPARGPILTAEVQWTPTAKQQIEDGEFRFISGEFGFEDRDKKTGLMTKAKDFVAATLTNRPFFTNLAALAADGGVVWDYEQGVNWIQQRLTAAFNPGDPNYMNMRYWVNDVDVRGSRVLVCENDVNGDTFVVGYTMAVDGTIALAPRADWIAVEQAWVADSDASSVAASRRLLAIATVLAATWSTSYVNSLPDDAFLYIKPGGKKDSDGKTVPRDNRMFPYKDANGDVDLPHLRNAAARIPQSDLSDSLKEQLASKASRLLKQHGGDDSATTKGENVSEELKALAADLGLDEDATVEQITEAVTAMKEKADGSDELQAKLDDARAALAAAGAGDKVVSIDKDTLAQLKRDAEQGVTARRTQVEAEADALVEAAIKDGRITPASKDAWRAAILRDGDLELFEPETAALAALAKGRVPVEERVQQSTGDTDGGRVPLDIVRASFGLKPRDTATAKGN